MDSRLILDELSSSSRQDDDDSDEEILLLAAAITAADCSRILSIFVTEELQRTAREPVLYKPPGVPTTLDRPHNGSLEARRIWMSAEFCRNRTGLEPETFRLLQETLCEYGLAEKCGKVQPTEKLLIYLDYVRTRRSMRQLRSTYQHSLRTFAKTLHSVNRCLLRLYKEVVIAPDTEPSRIMDDPKYRPFRGAVGAVDGCHIPMVIPSAEQNPWRNRKQFISTNVMAACDFDGNFTFIQAGWEGSAHDSRVLQDSMQKGFRVPPECFYLADAGYGSTHACLLTPYLKTRYHLKEQGKADKQPETHRELFNLRHASLRNVVECVFGILKSRFEVLDKGAAKQTSIRNQIRYIYALAALHNWLNRHSRAYQLILAEERERASHRILQPKPEPIRELPGGGSIKREAIAKQCWDEYQNVLQSQVELANIDLDQPDSEPDNDIITLDDSSLGSFRSDELTSLNQSP